MMNCDLDILKKDFFYHGSDFEFGIGEILLPKRREKLLKRAKRVLILENIFEEIREKEFADRPSRLDCVYVAHESKKALEKDYLYKVSASGNMFFTDQNLFTFAGTYAKSKDEIRDYARAYWSDGKISYDRPEILVCGEVKIKEIIK
jgi:hypothetical protein